jgi:dihydroneopterin aldolase
MSAEGRGGRRRGDQDRIELRGLRVVGVHGVLPEEKQRAQPFRVDLDIGLDMNRAVSTDELDETVNYAQAAEAAASEVEETSFDLLETLATAIGRRVLAVDARAEWVGVTVSKLRPPVPLDVESVAVRTVVRREPPL